MAFCPKCGAHHDPDIPCFDRAGEMLRDMGVERPSKMSKQEFKKLEKTTNRLMFRISLIVIGVFLLLILVAILLERYI